MLCLGFELSRGLSAGFQGLGLGLCVKGCPGYNKKFQAHRRLCRPNCPCQPKPGVACHYMPKSEQGTGTAHSTARAVFYEAPCQGLRVAGVHQHHIKGTSVSLSSDDSSDSSDSHLTLKLAYARRGCHGAGLSTCGHLRAIQCNEVV